MIDPLEIEGFLLEKIMEVLQIGPAAFGPQFVGPGTGSVGGCVFDASIGGVAYARLFKENNQRAAEDAMLVDVATARSEKQGEIGHYKLLAKQTTYRDKITDQIISEKTLVSPDFNYEAAAVWTSAGEPGTVGTTAEYKGTVDRARELAQIDGDASMFWVSPASEGENSRAYLWVKKGDEVDAYQYILPGSRKAISNTMKSLGYRGNTRLEEQTIIQKGSEQKIHHKDVYQALVSSLSQKETAMVKPILDKFRQEIEIPDNTRKERLKSYQKEYGTELNSERLEKEYKTDIGQWLESVASGFAAIPGLVRDARRENATISQDTAALMKREKPVQAIVGDFASYDHFNKQRENTVEEQLRHSVILQHIIPGIIGLTEIIAGYSKESESEKLALKEFNIISNGNVLVQNQATENHDLQTQMHKPNDDDHRFDKSLVADDYNPDFAEQLLWREFIAAIFVPTDIAEQSDRMLFVEQTESIQVDKVNGSLREEMNLGEILAEFIPVAGESDVQKPLLAGDKKEKKVLIADFQQGLEIIAQFTTNPEDSKLDQNQEEEKTKQTVVEADVVSLGEKLLGVLVDDLKITEGIKDKVVKPQIDELVRLSFLLRVYKDPDSSEIVRDFLVSLIYKQIEKIMGDNEILTQNPEFEEIGRMFRNIAPRASFLEAQFDILISFLKKNYPEDIFDRENDNPISQIIYMIFQLPKPHFSFEKLPGMKGRKMQNIFSPLSNNKRKKQKQSRGGVIFGPDTGIIYEYFPLDFRFNQEVHLRYLSRSVDV